MPLLISLAANIIDPDNEPDILRMIIILGEKELKPVSFRVREAAEGLLTVIMEHLVCRLSNGSCIYRLKLTFQEAPCA